MKIPFTFAKLTPLLLTLSTFFSSLSAFSANEARICGRFEIVKVPGMLQVQQPVLHVPANSASEAEALYLLSNTGDSVGEVAKRQALIASMTEGKNYCITGSILELDNVLEMTPSSIEDAP